MRGLSVLRRDNRGTSAVEFAILLPAFITFIVGGINVCLALYAVSSLNFAVQQAARCASVNATDCGDASAIQTFAQSHYFALGHPTFTYTAQACGNVVGGAIDYRINAIIAQYSVPLTASACFP